MNGLCLKIIAKGEIAQHLKKGAMAGSFSDILNIAGADTLLTGGHAFPWRNLLPCKIWL